MSSLSDRTEKKQRKVREDAAFYYFKKLTAFIWKHAEVLCLSEQFKCNVLIFGANTDTNIWEFKKNRIMIHWPILIFFTPTRTEVEIVY